jgi:hypothetical protein
VSSSKLYITSLIMGIPGEERERERKGGDANPGKQAGVKGLKVSIDSKNLIWKIGQLIPQLL